jgi:hypothetical protein
MLENCCFLEGACCVTQSTGLQSPFISTNPTGNLTLVCGRQSQSSVRPRGYNLITRNREVQRKLLEQSGEPSGKAV